MARVDLITALCCLLLASSHAHVDPANLYGKVIKLMSINMPDYGLEGYISNDNRAQVGLLAASFEVSACTTNGIQGIRLEDENGRALRKYENRIYIRNIAEDRDAACFGMEPSPDRDDMFRLIPLKLPNSRISLNLNGKLRIDQNSDLKKDEAYFYAIDAVSPEMMTLFRNENFKGDGHAFTKEVEDIASHELLSEDIKSIKVQGHFSWEVFSDTHFEGAATVLTPGHYDAEFLKTITINSLRIMGGFDSLQLYTDDYFYGESSSLIHSEHDLTNDNITRIGVQSLVVVGPNKWQLFEEPGFTGRNVILSPGRYIKSVLSPLLPFPIRSTKLLNQYGELCDRQSGPASIIGRDGSAININAIHHDGGVWIGFESNGNWRYEAEAEAPLQLQLFSHQQLDTLNNLEFTDFHVDSDIQLLLQSQKGSFHPSSLNVMRIGADWVEKLSFISKPNDGTKLTFSADYKTLKCSAGDGPSLCGDSESHFPSVHEMAGPMLIMNISFNPRGIGAFADGDWSRNAYTFKGTTYSLYVKLAACPMESLAGKSLPTYMVNDGYTRNTTGCVCDWDPRRSDCACCSHVGCPCGEAYKYQCVRCGYENQRCGHPSIEHNEFTFEVTDSTANEEGEHYEVPQMCVTSCVLSVDALSSSASKIGAYMSDGGFHRRLACVVDTPRGVEGLNRTVESYANLETGVPVHGVHFYGYNGEAFINQLKLRVNPAGCSESSDSRLMGCFKLDETLLRYPIASSHMTQQFCMDYCQKHHYKFAHIYKADYCGCSNEMLPYGSSLGCDLSCTGDNLHACGGHREALTFQLEVSDVGGYFAAPQGCAAVGAETINTRMAAQLPSNVCKQLTGSGKDITNMIQCFMEWCRAPHVTPNGLYVSFPNSCGARFVSKIGIRMKGSECLAMGGNPDYSMYKMGYCELDFCRATSKDDAVYEAIHVGGCEGNTKIGEGSLRTSGIACSSNGGAMTKFVGNQVDHCTFDWCLKKGETMEGNVYTYPMEISVTAETSMTYKLPSEMCISEIDAMVVSEGNAGTVTIFSDGIQVSKSIVAGGSSLVFGYSDSPTGTLTDHFSVTAAGASYHIESLQVVIDPEGCKEHEDAIVLYEQKMFNGKRLVIRNDTSHLDEFINKASSLKVLGDSLWQLHENANYDGKSVVLASGEYPTPDVLPFGDNDLESVRRVASLDMPRTDISNYYGQVCFERKVNFNTLYGLIEDLDGVKRFDFGFVNGDAAACEAKCRAQVNCAAWTLTTYNYPDFPGRCFGRNFHHDVEVYEAETVSGIVADCSKEDMVILYPVEGFGGSTTIVINNEYNITTMVPKSIRITGKDTWILITQSGTGTNRVGLVPGEYSNLGFATTGGAVIKQIIKLKPVVQQYTDTDTPGMGELYPVISNQIEMYFPGLTNRTCDNTQRAEIAFITDSSASIGSDNYKKVLAFMQRITSSFRVGVDAVRVAVLIFDKYLYYDLKLGQYNTLASVQAAIGNLRYYSGNTYTHKAIQKTYTEILNDTNCRDRVARIGIVITDGASAWPEETVTEAQIARSSGINMIAVGVNDAVYEELVAIAGDQSRVFHVKAFDELDNLVEGITQTTCSVVVQKEVVQNQTEYTATEQPGDDEEYFETETWEFIHKAHPLGMQAEIIYDKQILAASQVNQTANHCRLNHTGGWVAAVNTSTWIQVDFGEVLPVHGIGTQGNSLIIGWVTKYKIAISLDGINFNILKNTSGEELIFTGNADQNTVKHHCWHRIFGEVIYARFVRIIIIEWHITITMRVEFYGFRQPDDPGLLKALEKDVWTRNVTGCPCYFDPSRTDCACCEDGGCQCGGANMHQCVQCGYPHNCGTPNIRHGLYNVDGWTLSMTGCVCQYNPILNDCACCQNHGCQCGERNKNQCVNCGHPEHCGLKEHIFGPNPYCYEKRCPTNHLLE